MKPKDILTENYTQRINDILDISWRLLKSRFIDGRHLITQEAPFQHHFSHIISTIGESYCTKKEDIFLVDLETKCDGIKGKSKYIDITCGFPNQNASCAIELKFKTKKQSAADNGRIDAFIDIEALELVCDTEFSIGRFYMITNNTQYINQSRIGVGTKFTTYDGAVVTPGKYAFQNKSRNVVVTLKNQYKFEWEKIGEWYFLQINIP